MPLRLKWVLCAVGALAALAACGLLTPHAGSGVSAAPAADTGRDFLPVPSSGPLAGTTVYANSHALLIGVNEYVRIPREGWLEFAVNDVTSLREVLVRSYGFPAANVTVLTNADATADRIRKALAALADRRRVQPEDRVLVYYSGHGQTVKLPTGGEMGFLIPHDADVDLSDPGNAGPFLATCLPMKAIWDYLESSPAKHVLLLADACYSGLLARPRALQPVSPEALAALAGRRAVQVITAGRRGEVSYEMSRFGHGAFTQKLLEELKAQAATPGSVVTATELYASLKRGVADLSGGKQTPQMGDYDTEGDFLFIPTRPAPVEITPPPGQIPARPDQVQVNEADGAEMVYVPAGEFIIGTDPSEIAALWQRMGWDEVWKQAAKPKSAEFPRHRVTLPGFRIYKHEVTFAQYSRFLRVTAHPAPTSTIDGFSCFWQGGRPAPGRENQPVVFITRDDARAYARWAGCRLPTEAEWEKAARGTDGRLYPWGNAWDARLCNCGERVMRQPLLTLAAWKVAWNAWGARPVGTRYADSLQPVGSYPAGASPYGCLDMAGNVWEFTSSAYVPYPYVRGDGRDENGRTMVVRGGAWCEAACDLRCATRGEVGLDWRDRNVGFRCVLP